MELFGYIVKWAALGLLIFPLVILNQKILYKEDKQLSIMTIVVIYLLMVTMFVFNEYYHFIPRLG